jgi:hypothetical protein
MYETDYLLRVIQQAGISPRAMPVAPPLPAEVP